MIYTQGSAIPTQSRTTQYFLCCLLIIALVMPSPVGLFAQSQTDNEVPAAGRIISVAGDVNALDPDGNSRELTRRDEVFVGDTIYTGATGFAQIRLADDGLVALRALTEFAIVDYQFEEDPDNDVSVFQLLEGGMRTVTGAIGEQNRSRYRLNVGPSAYIGIRGTDYEAVITSSGVIATGVYDGGITIGNQVGSIDLGINADYDFAIMVDPNTLPQGLVAQPALLGLVQFVDVPDEAVNNVADGANDAATDGQANDGNGTPAAAQVAGAVNNAPAAAGDQALIANAADNSTAAGSNPNSDSSLGFAAPTPTLNDTVVSARGIVATDGQPADGDSSSVTVNPNEIAGDGAIATPTGTVRNTLASTDASVDVSASGSSSGSTGVDVSGGTSTTVDGGVGSATGGNNLAGGSGADGGTTQVTTDNDGTASGNTGTGVSVDGSVAVAGTDGNDGASTSASGSAGTDGASASADVNAGGTDAGVDVTVNSDGTVDTTVDLPGNDGSSSGGDSGDDGSDGSSGDGTLPPLLLQGPETSIAAYGVDWGKWGSSVDDNWVVVSNIDSELVQISTSDYFANVIPTEIAQMTGTHTYSTGIASSFLGSGSAGEIGSLSAAMQVNFDTGLINNGSLDVLVADQHWSVNFDGAISGGDVALDALNGSLQQGSVYSSNNIDASLDGVFTGNQAEAFVGGFELLDLNNQNNFAEGLFTIER